MDIFLLYILLVWLVVYRFIALNSINLVLSFFAHVVAPFLKLNNKFVQTVRSVRHQLNVDASVQRYAVCKKCLRLRQITNLDLTRLRKILSMPMPVRLRLRGSLARLSLHATAAPPSNTLAARLARARADNSPAHPSPLHRALDLLAPVAPPLNRVEMLLPKVRIAASKEEAAQSLLLMLEGRSEGDVTEGGRKET